MVGGGWVVVIFFFQIFILFPQIFSTYVYPEGQKGAAKWAESPEDRLVLYLVSKISNQ